MVSDTFKKLEGRAQRLQKVPITKPAPIVQQGAKPHKGHKWFGILGIVIVVVFVIVGAIFLSSGSGETAGHAIKVLDSGGNLYAHYDFKNGLTDNVGNNGALNAENIEFKDGVLNFANTNGLVQLPTHLLNGAEEFSISLWFKPTKSGLGILSGSNSRQDYALLIWLTETEYQFYTNQQFISRAKITPTINTWHHLAVSRHKSGKADLFFNGELLTPADSRERPGKILLESLILGQDTDCVFPQECKGTPGGINPDEAFSGQMRDLEFYSSPLSEQEVKSIYDDEGGFACPENSAGTVTGSDLCIGGKTLTCSNKLYGTENQEKEHSTEKSLLFRCVNDNWLQYYCGGKPSNAGPLEIDASEGSELAEYTCTNKEWVKKRVIQDNDVECDSKGDSTSMSKDKTKLCLFDKKHSCDGSVLLSQFGGLKVVSGKEAYSLFHCKDKKWNVKGCNNNGDVLEGYECKLNKGGWVKPEPVKEVTPDPVKETPTSDPVPSKEPSSTIVPPTTPELPKLCTASVGCPTGYFCTYQIELNGEQIGYCVKISG